MERCINIDWLELFCIEDSLNFPHDSEYFRAMGFSVVQREYGTPMYQEMFTILDDNGNPWLEIRRSPKPAMTWPQGGMFDPKSAHVRLTNWACYQNDIISYLQTFIDTHGFHYQRISRIDLCLDFIRFDSGDIPVKFIRRYLSGRYSKINQANIRAHGADRWDGRDFSSLSWGSPSSMVCTKLYDKTKELAEAKDKPYIRHAWFACHLVNDPYHLTAIDEQGNEYKPRIFRLEFSLKSSVKNWVVVEDNTTERLRKISMRNDLSCYLTRQQLLTMFFSLCRHYFHFKKYRQGVRKDRCEDKVLFHPEEIADFFEIDRNYTSDVQRHPYHSLLTKLWLYRDNSYDGKQRKAAETLIKDLEQRCRIADMKGQISESELTIMRQVISRRLQRASIPVNDVLEQVKAQMELYANLFGEI